MFEIIAPNSPRDDPQRIAREAAAAAPSLGLRERIDVASQGRWWAHKGSSLGPLPCEGYALPLSYARSNRKSRNLNCLTSVAVSPKYGNGSLLTAGCDPVVTGRNGVVAAQPMPD